MSNLLTYCIFKLGRYTTPPITTHTYYTFQQKEMDWTAVAHMVGIVTDTVTNYKLMSSKHYSLGLNTLRLLLLLDLDSLRGSAQFGQNIVFFFESFCPHNGQTLVKLLMFRRWKNVYHYVDAKSLPRYDTTSSLCSLRRSDQPIKNFNTKEHRIFSRIVRTFFKANYVEIFPEHYTWKVPEKGFILT